MFAIYSMTDTFIGKSFMIGLGISQTNILAEANYDTDYKFNFLKYESPAYRNNIVLEYALPVVIKWSDLDGKEMPDYPTDLFTPDLEDKSIVVNSAFAKAANITGTFDITFALKATETPYEQIFLYKFKILLKTIFVQSFMM